MTRTVTIVSLILFFALSFAAIAASGSSLFRESDGVTDQNGTTPPPGSNTLTDGNKDPDKPDGGSSDGSADFPAVYVSSLKNVLMISDVEGLTDDRSSLSLQERTELYNRLVEVALSQESDVISASGVYSPETHYLTLVREGLFEEYTAGTEVIKKYNKEYSTYDASYVTHSTDVTRERCKVIPYMGYLLVSNLNEDGATCISLCDGEGNVLVQDMADKVPHFSRDYSNRPVFTDSAGKYYYYNGTKFVSVSREKIRAELYYDYPAVPLADYNGKTEVKYLPGYGQYRFVNYTNGANFITTRYKYAFNFAENGLAVVMETKENVVKIINTSAKRAIGSSAWKIFPSSGAYVEYVFTLPDTLGIESIGCSGFDSGWLRLRVRALSRMRNSYDTVVEDVERIVNTEGEYLDIPQGYTVEGYSNGVVLLSKEGLYGYYSVNGHWIAQPIFDYARPFVQGLAVVGYENGTVGMIDTEGNIVLPMIYTHISDLSSGVISAYIEGVGWNIYNLCEAEDSEG